MAPKKTILIIDDDNRNIFALRAVLKSMGYICIATTDPHEGFSMVTKDDTIGIVLLDMMMPEMDGYELLAKIRAGKYATLPVVAVTAQAMVGDEEKCLMAGANAYLSKPVDVDKLSEYLQHYLH
jgi:two-component system, cell cycle response regulator DivK